MNRKSVFFPIGFLLASPLLVDARAQSQATVGDRSTRSRSSPTDRPSRTGVRSEFLKTYAPKVPGLPGFGSGSGGGGGGSMKGTRTPSPLQAGHKDPSSYQRKPRAPRLDVPKPRKGGKARAMAAAPARPGHARHDRTYVNGLTPQHSLYLGNEGSSIRREPDSRAALAKLSASSKSKSRKAAGRPLSSNARKPRGASARAR